MKHPAATATIKNKRAARLVLPDNKYLAFEAIRILPFGLRPDLST